MMINMKFLIMNWGWIGLILSGLVGLLFYKKYKDWLSVAGVLINAIEFIDKEVKDIIPDKAMVVMEKIKGLVNKTLKPSDKKLLDEKLKQFGYKND